LGGGADGAVLLVGGEVAVEGKSKEAVGGEESGGAIDGAADLASAGEKDEYVTRPLSLEKAFAEKLREGLLDEVLKGKGRGGGVAEVGFKEAAFAADDGAVVEMAGDGVAIEGGGHDQEFEVGPAGELEAAEEGEGEVAFEMAFVEFVEDDGGDVAEVMVGEEAAGQDAFGQEAETGLLTGDVLKADLIPNGLPQRLTEFFGNAAGGETSRQPARLEDPNFSRRVKGKETGRDAGRLPGSGWRFEDNIR
jgi:hypothetical protein